MAVTVHDTALSDSNTFSATTTVTQASLNVTAGSTAVMGVLATGSTVTGVSVTWNGVAMTLVSSSTNGTIAIRIYGLTSPATGTLSMVANWTGSSVAILQSISFAGTATSVAAAFKLANQSTGSTTSATLTASSVVGNLSVAAGANSGSSWTNLAATGSTSFNNDTGSIGQIASYATGAASVAWSATTAATPWALASIDVSVTVASTQQPYARWSQLAPILAQ